MGTEHLATTQQTRGLQKKPKKHLRVFEVRQAIITQVEKYEDTLSPVEREKLIFDTLAKIAKEALGKK